LAETAGIHGCVPPRPKIGASGDGTLGVTQIANITVPQGYKPEEVSGHNHSPSSSAVPDCASATPMTGAALASLFPLRWNRMAGK
jgi:hypothetical protein